MYAIHWKKIFITHTMNKQIYVCKTLMNQQKDNNRKSGKIHEKILLRRGNVNGK